eukprot:gene7410-15135_t
MKPKIFLGNKAGIFKTNQATKESKKEEESGITLSEFIEINNQPKASRNQHCEYSISIPANIHDGNSRTIKIIKIKTETSKGDTIRIKNSQQRNISISKRHGAQITEEGSGNLRTTQAEKIINDDDEVQTTHLTGMSSLPGPNVHKLEKEIEQGANAMERFKRYLARSKEAQHEQTARNKDTVDGSNKDTKAMASKGGRSAAMRLEAGRLVHEGSNMTVRSAVRTPDRPTRVQTNMHVYMHPN